MSKSAAATPTQRIHQLLMDYRKQYEDSRRYLSDLPRKIPSTFTEMDVAKLNEEAEKAADDFVKRVKRSLVDRSRVESSSAERLRLWKDFSGAAAHLVQATVIGAQTLPYLGRDPWYYEARVIDPLSSELVKLQVYDKGSGFGWDAKADQYPHHATVVIEYEFVPDQTALWMFRSEVDFHGFYIVRADDDWWNSKEARVKIRASVKAYQYFFGAEAKYNVFSVEDDNINVATLFDESLFVDYSMNLRQGDSARVYIMLFFDAFAKGSGSYAEINFEGGNGNFVQPMSLLALPQ